jgi:protein TonB
MVSPLPVNRQQRNKLWKAKGAAYLLAAVLHGGLWQLYQTMPKPPSPEEPPVIEVRLVVQPKPAALAQPQAPALPPAAPPQTKMQAPPPSKPVPKVAKPAVKQAVEKPEKAEKTKQKPKPLNLPTAKPMDRSEKQEEAEPPPAEPVREAPRESHREASPAPPTGEEGHRAVNKAPPGPAEDTQYHPGGMTGLKRRYPHAALERGWEGTVTLKVHIQADGDIGEVLVVSSSGHDVLDEAAVDLIKEAHATPARRGDKSIDSWVIVPYRFTIPK